MTSNKALCCVVLLAISTSAWSARKPLHKPVKKHVVRSETLTCRDGTENRHARIAVVLVAGKPDSFAYYSKWKPRTCSIYLQRNRDAYSKWVDKGTVTTVSRERGLFLCPVVTARLDESRRSHCRLTQISFSRVY